MGARDSHLLIVPRTSRAVYHYLTPQDAGWEYLHFAARRMVPGEVWQLDTRGYEYGIVILGGQVRVTLSDGTCWEPVGQRSHVFEGLPHALYFPRNTRFRLEALTPVDLAWAWVAAVRHYPPRWIRPEDITVEIRGAGNATRQINNIIPPGFACEHLVAVEVYTPPGNWSSYPPHKHDEHRVDAEGRLLEADLEEVYFYKFDREEGFAYQRVYTGDGRLDELILARNNDLVLVPEGYHPVVSGHGYTTYYLNFLAGSAQSLANSDDPTHAWVKGLWPNMEKDPRVPIYSVPEKQRIAG